MTVKSVALVTGGTTGIGHASARLLHARGHSVVVTGRNPETLAEARRTLPEDVIVLRADAASLSDADAVANEIGARFGRLDVAFFNAAFVQMLPFDAIDEEAFDAHFDVNLKGAYFQLQRLLPLLRSGSSVIFTSSLIAERGFAQTSVYSATKGAQLALVCALSAELAPRGIRVNAVSPGVIDTPVHAKLNLPPEQRDAMRAALTSLTPLGRFGSPEEIAEMVGFLASDRAAFITGANLAVGGGFGVAV